MFKISFMCSNASLKMWASPSDCFNDDQLISRFKCFHSSIRRDFSWVTSWIRLRYTLFCSIPQIRYYSGLRSGPLATSQRDAAMKSGVSRVNSCSVSHHAPYGQKYYSCQQMSLPESGPMTALFNIMETMLFCHLYLKINNSTVKEYFLTKLHGSFRIQCTKFS